MLGELRNWIYKYNWLEIRSAMYNDLFSEAELQYFEQHTQHWMIRIKWIKEYKPNCAANRFCTLLDLSEKDIKNIDFISEFTEVRHLFLERNFISNISSLSHLSKLKKAVLIYNQIEDLTPLSESNVETLYLSTNHIEDTTPLKNIQTLKHLYITGNPLVNFEGLFGLSQLEELSIGCFRYPEFLPSLDFLNSMINLKYLRIVCNSNLEFENLLRIPKLRVLYLNNSRTLTKKQKDIVEELRRKGVITSRPQGNSNQPE